MTAMEPYMQNGQNQQSTSQVLAGIRVVEVATHVFVPMAGSILHEWGAEVIKIEDATGGDPYRTLATYGLHNVYKGLDVFFHSTNRGKKSIGINLKTEEGRALLAQFVQRADVFMTSIREDARRRLRIDVDDIRADNPSIIYVRGTAFGPKGPDAANGGYDAGAFWARSGMQYLYTPSDAETPARVRPSFGDVTGALAIAGGVGAALYRRAATGEPSVIDVSLLSVGMWQIGPDVLNAKLGEADVSATPPDRRKFWNPLWMSYKTRDNRFISFMMLYPDEHWPDLCRRLGAPEMGSDPRFATRDARQKNSEACVDALDDLFRAEDLSYWRKALEGFRGEWAAAQSPLEVHSDPQVTANQYVADMHYPNDVVLPVVTAPVQFDGAPGRPNRAPEHAEHTELELLELGVSWDEISDLKRKGVIT